MDAGDYVWIAVGLLVGVVIVRFSWRLTCYFCQPGGDAFGSMIGTTVGALGVVIGLAIIVLSVYFLFAGGPLFPVSSG